jgi:hypothetical protein
MPFPSRLPKPDNKPIMLCDIANVLAHEDGIF